MTSKIKPIVLNGHNFAIKDTYMETLLKSKGIWNFINISIADSNDAEDNFSINRKNVEVMGIIMTYILRDIFFHTREINCPHVIWTKMKTLFNKINEGEVMQI